MYLLLKRSFNRTNDQKTQKDPGFSIVWKPTPYDNNDFCQISHKKPYEVERVLVLFPFRETLLVELEGGCCPPHPPEGENWF